MTDSGVTRARHNAMPRTAMGPKIEAALEDLAVIDIMVNPDNTLRLDRHGNGQFFSAEEAEATDD